MHFTFIWSTFLFADFYFYAVRPRELKILQWKKNQIRFEWFGYLKKPTIRMFVEGPQVIYLSWFIDFFRGAYFVQNLLCGFLKGRCSFMERKYIAPISNLEPHRSSSFTVLRHYQPRIGYSEYFFFSIDWIW